VRDTTVLDEYIRKLLDSVTYIPLVIPIKNSLFLNFNNEKKFEVYSTASNVILALKIINVKNGTISGVFEKNNIEMNSLTLIY